MIVDDANWLSDEGLWINGLITAKESIENLLAGTKYVVLLVSGSNSEPVTYVCFWLLDTVGVI